MTWFEFAAVVVTLLSVWLTVRQVIWCWPTALVSVVMYGIVFYDARLYADMGLQGIYFVLSVYGWWAWRHGGQDQTELEVSRGSIRLYVLLVAIGSAFAILLGGILGRYTDAALPWMDSTLTSFSLVAQWMMTRKLLENWIVWVAVDVVYVGMFIFKDLHHDGGPLRGLSGAGGQGADRMEAVDDHRRGEAGGPGGAMIRVVVTGSECTGKTTLARGLAEHYGTTSVDEAVREYVETKGAPPEYEDVDAIARLHLAMADRDAKEAGEVLVFDTDLMSTWIYSHHYYGDCPGWIDSELGMRHGDLYLLAGIDVPWVADGNQRDRGHMREEMQALFRNELMRRGFPFLEIEGTHTARLRLATEAIDQSLRAHAGG